MRLSSVTLGKTAIKYREKKYGRVETAKEITEGRQPGDGEKSLARRSKDSKREKPKPEVRAILQKRTRNP